MSKISELRNLPAEQDKSTFIRYNPRSSVILIQCFSHYAVSLRKASANHVRKMQQEIQKSRRFSDITHLFAKKAIYINNSFILKYRIIPTGEKNSPVGPLSSKRRVMGVPPLVFFALVRADHTHLCDVVVLVRPLQKSVFES